MYQLLRASVITQPNTAVSYPILANTRSPEHQAAVDIYLHVLFGEPAPLCAQPRHGPVCPPILTQPLLSDKCPSTCSTGSLAGSVPNNGNNMRCQQFQCDILRFISRTVQTSTTQSGCMHRSQSSRVHAAAWARWLTISSLWLSQSTQFASHHHRSPTNFVLP